MIILLLALSLRANYLASPWPDVLICKTRILIVIESTILDALRIKCFNAHKALTIVHGPKVHY